MQVPHIFTPGFPSKAGEVNENFAALAAAITALEQKVAVLEGTNIPIPGKYFMMGFQTGLQAFGQEAVIEGIVVTANVTLTAEGGATLVVTEAKHELHINPNGAHRGGGFTQNEVVQGTWSLSPETGLQIFVPDDTGEIRRLRFARAAPRLQIGNHANPNDGSTVMLFLIRQGA